jgi:hypothetical protein
MAARREKQQLMKFGGITFLALARASLRRVEHTEVSLRACWTSLAEGLAFLLLVDVAEAVAADAAELSLLRLEEAYTAEGALSDQGSDQRKQFRTRQKLGIDPEILGFAPGSQAVQVMEMPPAE